MRQHGHSSCRSTNSQGNCTHALQPVATVIIPMAQPAWRSEVSSIPRTGFIINDPSIKASLARIALSPSIQVFKVIYPQSALVGEVQPALDLVRLEMFR